jgi:F-type H+-transporting ATPase subunit epsilon
MPAPRAIRLIVVTPEQQVLDEYTSSVVFSAHDGEVGILPLRAPLLCELGVGQLRYQTGGTTRRLYIEGGFAEVMNNTVTVLTQRALPVDQITPQTIAEAEAAVASLVGSEPGTVSSRREAQERLRVLRRLRAMV